MTNRWMIQASAVAAMMAAPASAQDKAPKEAMEMPKPPSEVAAAAKEMVGTWKCKGTAAASPMGPEHKYESTITYKLSPDKYWIVGTYSEKKSKEHPMVYKFTEYRTYDTKASKWVVAHIAEMGALLTGSGDTKGEDWTYKSVTTPMMPGDFHLVSTAKGAKEIELKGEMIGPDGKKPAFTSTCKK
jgi:Protein of unknown function (DUF1579)